MIRTTPPIFPRNTALSTSQQTGSLNGYTANLVQNVKEPYLSRLKVLQNRSRLMVVIIVAVRGTPWAIVREFYVAADGRTTISFFSLSQRNSYGIVCPDARNPRLPRSTRVWPLFTWLCCWKDSPHGPVLPGFSCPSCISHAHITIRSITLHQSILLTKQE